LTPVVRHWYELVRLRPLMYLGDTGRLGLGLLARALFECPRSPRKLSVSLDGPRLELSAVSVPLSVQPS
jgi:hypothetical protein